MNNLYKSIKVIALSVVAVIGMVGCQDKTDLLAIDAELAQQTMLGVYYYIDIDSTAMSTTLHEWKLEESEAGQVGYYRVISTGNGLESDTTYQLSWGAPQMAADGLSMTIPVTFNGATKELIWANGVIQTEDYVTTKSLISMATILKTVEESFLDMDFVFSDTADYITERQDTTYYLGWKTEEVYWPADSIQPYKDFIAANIDTIRWFNATYPNSKVDETPVFRSTPESSGPHAGLYKGFVPRPYEAKDIKTIKTNHGPLSINNSEMVFNRTSRVNTGSLFFHEQAWNEKCYTHPADSAAEHTDYTYSITDAKWTPLSLTNAKKFTILFKGKMNMTLVTELGGEVADTQTQEEEDFFFEVSLSAFNKADGEVMYNEHKYKLK